MPAWLSGKADWTTLVPILALVVLAATWGGKPPVAILAVAGLFLLGSVLAAVHHAEVVAHRVGEPFGALVLAVAVTVIEVGLIVTLMVSGKARHLDARPRHRLRRGDDHLQRHPRDVAARRRAAPALRRVQRRGHGHRAGDRGDAGDDLPRPARVHDEPPGPEFTAGQLAFVGGRLARPLLRCSSSSRPSATATTSCPRATTRSSRPHAEEAPTDREAIGSLALLVVALVAVVGLAKVESPAIEDVVDAIGAPQSAVGVVIALLVLLPRRSPPSATPAATGSRSASTSRLGSAMASIGLTIPAIAVASIWLDGPLVLGLGATQIVLLGITAVVGALTVLPGRATLQEGGVHLVLFGSFLFLALNP